MAPYNQIFYIFVIRPEIVFNIEMSLLHSRGDPGTDEGVCSLLSTSVSLIQTLVRSSVLSSCSLSSGLGP